MHGLIAVEKIAQWENLKTLVLDSVSSPITKRVYNMALDEFMAWFQHRRIRGWGKKRRLLGIRTNILDYKLDPHLPCPLDKAMVLARIPTRLKALSDPDQMRLINWAFAVCEAAIRKHVDQQIAPPTDFPNSGVGVG
jgi:hypothetical protein